MKNIFKTTIISASAFALFMTIYFCIFGIDISIIRTFIFSFFSFVFVFFLFMLYMSKKNDKIVEEIDGEIIYKGLANHFVGIESVGGHLFITNEKLIFKSHSFNIQNHSLEIPLSNIVELKPYSIFGMVPTGLEIIQKDKTDKFVVNDRNEIISILEQHKAIS